MDEVVTTEDEYNVPLRSMPVLAIVWLAFLAAALQIVRFIYWCRLTGVMHHTGALPSEYVNVLILAGSLVCFSLGFCVIAIRQYRHLRGHSIVSLSSEGIAIHTPALDINRLAWNDIEAIESYRILMHRFVGIIPKNSKEVRSRLNWWQRWTYSCSSYESKIDVRQGRSNAPIQLSQALMHISSDELVAHIRDFQARYRTDAESPADIAQCNDSMAD